MKKKRIITGITSFMVITAIILIITLPMFMLSALPLCTPPEKPAPTVQNVYIKEDDNSSDNNAETELETEGETEFVTLPVNKRVMIFIGFWVMLCAVAVAVGVYTYMKLDKKLSNKKLSDDEIAKFMSSKIP